MKVLIVDDSSTIRRIIINALSGSTGLEILEASDGLEGVAHANENPDIGLVLCDWNMPNMNGYELLCQFRESNKETPFIMVTTEAEKDNIIKAMIATIVRAVSMSMPVTLRRRRGPASGHCAQRHQARRF